MSAPKILVVATNIKWSVTEEEALELLDDMPDEEAARIFELPVERYAEMTVEERHDYALDAWQHNRVSIEEFVHAPEEIALREPAMDAPHTPVADLTSILIIPRRHTMIIAPHL